MRPPLFAFYLMAALGTAACSGAADVPETPDLRALLLNYEHPTASLDISSVADAVSSSPQIKQLAAGLQSALYVMDEVNYASRTPATASSKDRVSLQGSLELKIRCPGAGADPNYADSANGSLSLTLAVADNLIKRGMAGQANACVLQTRLGQTPARIQLDGPMDFDMGGDLALGQTWSGTLLISLRGELRVADFPPITKVSGRFASGRFQSLVTLPNGKTAVLELSDAGITVRDESGVWFCAEGESCVQQ